MRLYQHSPPIIRVLPGVQAAIDLAGGGGGGGDDDGPTETGFPLDSGPSALGFSFDHFDSDDPEYTNFAGDWECDKDSVTGKYNSLPGGPVIEIVLRDEGGGPFAVMYWRSPAATHVAFTSAGFDADPNGPSDWIINDDLSTGALSQNPSPCRSAAI